jgi:hypothetical protein
LGILRQPYLRDHHSERTSLNPSDTRAITCAGNVLTRCVSNPRSTVSNCDTFTTDGFDKPESDFPIRKLPGASASVRFEVMTAMIAVAMRLSLKGLDWTMSTGRRIPGPDPTGSGRDAHHTSPRFMFKASRLRNRPSRIEFRRFVFVNGIKALCHVVRRMRVDIICQGFGVKLATRLIEIGRQHFSRMKNQVGYGDRNFHTPMVSPWYE